MGGREVFAQRMPAFACLGSLGRLPRTDLMVAGLDPGLLQYDCSSFIPVASANAPFEHFSSFSQEDALFIDQLLASHSDVSDDFTRFLAGDARPVCLLDPPIFAEGPAHRGGCPFVAGHSITPASTGPCLQVAARGPWALPSSLEGPAWSGSCTSAAVPIDKLSHHGKLSPACSNDLSSAGQPMEREGSTGSHQSSASALPGFAGPGSSMDSSSGVTLSSDACHQEHSRAPNRTAWPQRTAAGQPLGPATVGGHGVAAADGAVNLLQTPACAHAAKMPRQQQRAAVQKARQKHRNYMNRRRAREGAVHANAEAQANRKAALEMEVGNLLMRHEELTRQQPWLKQHEAVTFIASIASMLPAGTISLEARPTIASSSDLLQKVMLAPWAAVDEISMAAGIGAAVSLHPGDLANVEAGAWCTDADSSSASGAVSWRSILACLCLSKVQKESIAALYSAHLQQSKQLHQDCLAIASKLQLLPGVQGKLTDRTWPHMTTHLISGQLAGITRRAEALTATLNSACCQVLSVYQQNYLKALAPCGPLDVRSLCREVLASLEPPPKAGPIHNGESANKPCMPGVPSPKVSSSAQPPQCLGGGSRQPMAINDDISADMAAPAMRIESPFAAPPAVPTPVQPFSHVGGNTCTTTLALGQAAAAPSAGLGAAAAHGSLQPIKAAQRTTAAAF